MKIRTFDPNKQKTVIVGEYKHFIFHKNAEPQHYMYKEKGYGIQDDVIKGLKELNCKKVVIHTPVRNYAFHFADWLKIVPKNYGHGMQRFLPISQAIHIHENQMTLFE